MKKIILSLVVSLGVSGVVQAGSGDPQAGKAKTAVCAACHGPTGNSMAPNFPKLAGQGEGYLVKQIQDIKSGERKVLEMTGMVENLSDQDIADISAFYASQAVSVGQVDPKHIALGEKLYRGGDVDRGIPACSSCHSPTGKGNSLAKFPLLSGQHPDYIGKTLRDFREGVRVNDGETKIMRTIAEKLSNKEIDALASYINGLH
ncbi:MAG: cytochrome c4 [Oceanospirillales bacterium LUC14_002_19_P2]|nr:MAG: cytochrome c4 [Oceanospirillales bacterium LUC14_002_19_P2]